MKKFFKAFISITLVIAMLLGMGICGFAADTDKKVYTCLGDSNSAGYGTEGYVYSMIPAPYAYHTIVSEELDMELRLYGVGGFRTDEIRYMLDPEFEMNWEYAEFCMGDVKKEEIDVYKEDYIQAVVDADYLTIQVGLNDILGEALTYALDELEKPVEFIAGFRALLESVGIIDETVDAVLNTLEKAIQYVNLLNTLVKEMTITYYEFCENWDAIIKNIYRLNPDVEIIALSVFNPFNNTSIYPGSPINVGKIFSLYFNKYNKWITEQSEYADTYTFCNTNDLLLGDLAFTQEDFWEVYLPAFHPSTSDHAIIADRIIDIIEEIEAK